MLSLVAGDIMQRELPIRKTARLCGYDYSQAGYYFVTICTKDKHEILGHIVGADDSVRPSVVKSQIGIIVENSWHEINRVYENVKAVKFCVMPNHIHGIIVIENTGGQSRPPLQKVIQGYKSVTTRMCFTMGCRQIWQRSYNDHVIRNESEYLKICQYIDKNPAQWEKDRYYTKQPNTYRR